MRIGSPGDVSHSGTFEDFDHTHLGIGLELCTLAALDAHPSSFALLYSALSLPSACPGPALPRLLFYPHSTLGFGLLSSCTSFSALMPLASAPAWLHLDGSKDWKRRRGEPPHLLFRLPLPTYGTCFSYEQLSPRLEMFLGKALAWSPPELFYKLTWWRGSPPKKEEEGDEGLVKEETPPPMAAAPPARAWLRWNFQMPSMLGYLRWWGHSAADQGDGVIGAPEEETFVKSELPEPMCFRVQDVSPAEGMRWGLRRALRRTPMPPSDLETPEHYQICFNFIRHLVDLCVVSFLWLSSPVFRLGLDIVGLRGMVKLWLHGMAMFLVASYGLHLVFWLVQEYLLQFACLFGLLQVLVLSVSIQAGLEVEEVNDGATAKEGFVLGEHDDTNEDLPKPQLHSQEKPPPEHKKDD